MGVEKEDGQNDNVICQLKSTDANSIKINKKDIDTLLYNAEVVHKLPVFAINFLSDNSVYLLIRPEDLEDMVRFLNTGKISSNNLFEVDIKEESKKENVSKKRIKSCSNARESFNKENELKFKKERRSAT